MSTPTNNLDPPPHIDHFGEVSVVRYPDGRTVLLREGDCEQLPLGTARSIAVNNLEQPYWNWTALAAVGLSVVIASWELSQQLLPRWHRKLSSLVAWVTPMQRWAKLTNLRRHLEFVYDLKRASSPAPAHSRAQGTPRRKP